MYSYDILPLPGQQFRSVKNLGLLNLDHYSNQDQQSSSRIRKPTCKLKLLSLNTFKKDEGKNFYHHTSIYNLKEYHNLTKSPVFFLSGNTNKLNQMQAKVLLTDFQRKVTDYLNQIPNSKNNKQYYSGIKPPGYSKEYETYQTILHTQQEELLNRSLCLNKYNYKPEFSDVGIEVMLMDSKKSLSKQIIPNERIQNRLLKFMEKYLNNEHIDYDQKMQMMTKQYHEIVKKIKTKTFKIKVPNHYQIQMSDFNDYYQVNERKKREYLQQQLDSLADQIIQSIHQSQDSLSSSRESQSDINELEYAHTSPNNQVQDIQQDKFNDIEDDDRVDDMKQSKKTSKQKDSKKLTKKQSIKVQRSSTIQRQESDTIQQLNEQSNPNQQREQRKPTIQQIQPIHEEELKQTIQEIAEELKKPNKKHLTKAQREEQKKRKKEIQRIHEDIERIKREKGGDFEYEKTDSDSEDRFRRQKQHNQFDDMFKPRQVSRRQSHQFDQSEGENLEYASEQEVEDRNKIQRVEQIIQQKLDPNYQYNPQEFWQQEVKINVKKPQLPNGVSQQRQQEQFLQYQREKLEQQMQMINQKYTNKPNDTSQLQYSQQQLNNLQQQAPKTQQQQQIKYDQQIPSQNKSSTQQQHKATSYQDETQKQNSHYSVQKSFKTPQSIPSQQNNQDSLHGIQDRSVDNKQNSQAHLPQQIQDVDNGVTQIANQNQNQSQNKNQQQVGQNDQKQKIKGSSTKKQELTTSDDKSQKLSSMKKIDQEGIQISKSIEQKLNQVQFSLSRYKLGMIEKMMAAQSVYDVDIHEYKLTDFPLNQTVFPKLNGEDEKLIFQQLYSWQKETYKTIPILYYVNRNLIIPDEKEETDSQLVSSDDDDN